MRHPGRGDRWPILSGSPQPKEKGWRSPQGPCPIGTETSRSRDLPWDEALPDKRPGILIIHGGAGLDDHAKSQARRYAALGFVVLACDMFGNGVAGDRERVMASVMGLRDYPQRMCQRGQAGLAAARTPALPTTRSPTSAHSARPEASWPRSSPTGGVSGREEVRKEIRASGNRADFCADRGPFRYK